MLDILTIVAASLGGGALASILIQLLVKYRLDRHFEAHKAGLARANEEFRLGLERCHNSELERFKSDLQVTASRQIKGYEFLVSKRFRATQELFTVLNSLDETIARLTAPFQPAGGKSQEDLAKDVAAAFQAVYRFFRPNRILFPLGFCRQVEELSEVYRFGYIDYTTYQQWWNVDDGDIRLKDFEARRGASKSLKEKVPVLLAQVEHSIREMLHVTDGISLAALSTDETPLNSDRAQT